MTRYADDSIKKKREQLQLKLFCEYFSEINGAKFSILKNDPPDGEIQIGDKKISIELTQIFWDTDKDGFNKKAQESTADIIMDLAEKKYNDLGLTPLQVNVSFVDKYGLEKYGDTSRLNSSDKEKLSDYIVKKVIECSSISEDKMFEVPQYDDYGKRLLDAKIESIYITRYSFIDENCWSADGGGIIPSITIDKINEAVSKKNADLKGYNHLYDQSWLVIVEDWIGISGYFSFRNAEDVIDNSFETEFDRVFILRRKERKVIELKITR